MLKSSFLLYTTLLLLPAYGQVEFKEVIFQQSDGDSRCFWVINEERSKYRMYGSLYFFQSEIHPYFISLKRETIVDFVPVNFNGKYSVYVGDIVTTDLSEKKAKNSIYTSQKIFRAEINTNLKPGSVIIDFNCSNDCNATVNKTQTKYLPLLLETSKNISVLILTGNQNERDFRKGKEFAELLNHYGFKSEVRRVHSYANYTTEQYENLPIGCISQILRTKKSQNNKYLTNEMYAFLTRICDYSGFFQFIPYVNRNPFFGEYLNYPSNPYTPPLTTKDQDEFDFVFQIDLFETK